MIFQITQIVIMKMYILKQLLIKNRQDCFLSFIDNSITDLDNEELTKYISDEEIFFDNNDF